MVIYTNSWLLGSWSLNGWAGTTTTDGESADKKVEKRAWKERHSVILMRVPAASTDIDGTRRTADRETRGEGSPVETESVACRRSDRCGRASRL